MTAITVLPPISAAAQMYLWMDDQDRCGALGACEATPMITESRRYKGYVIDLVYNATRWEAIIYPLSKLVRQLNPDLPPIHYKTKEKAFEAACKRIDEFQPIK